MPSEQSFSDLILSKILSAGSIFPILYLATGASVKNFFQSRKSLYISTFSILFAFFLIFIMAGSNRIKDYLNDVASGSIISRPYSEMQTILPDYFNYLFNAAFWISAGNFPDNFDDVELNLLDMDAVNSMSGVTAVNYVHGDSWTSFLLKNGTVEMEKHAAPESLQPRIPLEKDIFTHTKAPVPSRLFISPLHNLLSRNEVGFSIELEIADSPRTLVSLDISLSRFIQFYKDIFSENAVLFSIFTNGDYIAIPLDSNLVGERSENLQLYYNQLVSSVMEQVDSEPSKRPQMFEYDERRWVVSLFKLDEYGSTSGFILPESELFFSQYDKIYVFIAIPFLLLFIVLITLFFISRHYERNKMSEEEKLVRLIDNGEGKYLEFKSSLRWDYRENCLNKKLEEVVLKSISAFANSSGGILLIGVDDDGTPLGLEPDYKTLKHPNRDGYELHLRNLVSSLNGTFASRKMNVAFISVHDKDICKVTVKSAGMPLFALMTDKNGAKQEQFYIRDGNMSRRIDSLKDITVYCSKRFNS